MHRLSIMFVCLGNICRSPLAQAVLEHLIREEDLEDLISVESSGTDAYHVGENADSRMRRTARSHGVTIDHQARKFRRRDMEEYDLVLTMDMQNFSTVRSMCRTEGEADRVRLFREFDPSGTGDVPDPWYGGNEGFEEVWGIVHRTCLALMENLRRRLAA